MILGLKIEYVVFIVFGVVFCSFCWMCVLSAHEKSLYNINGHKG